MESLHWFISQRRGGLLPQNVISRGVRDSSYLVKRLKNSVVLLGHHGCVNSVAWNETGTKLISGSDDCYLNIYDTATQLMVHSFHTSHQSNIFSAKFLPQTGDLKAVSCAGVGTVEVSELTPYGGYVCHQFKCQSSITYMVATSPGCPHEFLTCEEMGMVRLYDLRTCSSCHCDGNCNRSMLCRFPSAVTSMAVHPLEPHYVAVGLGDGTLRLLDRRWTDSWQDSTPDSPLQVLHASCLPVRYRPAAIRDQKLKITSVNFNPDGTQILASYSEDYVYLFNSGVHGGSDFVLTPHQVDRPRYLSQCERYPGGSHRRNTSQARSKPKSQQRTAPGPPPAITNRLQSSFSSPEGAIGGHGRAPPANKRIRLRGDWSDTGPEARPEDQEQEPEPEQGARRGNLMNRMSRLFERWMDMALDSVSGSEGEGEGEGEGEREGEREGEGDSDTREEEESSEMEEVGATERDKSGPRMHESSTDTPLDSSSDSESDRGGDVNRAPSSAGGVGGSSSEATGQDRDLWLIQDAAESSMQRAVQDAVHRAMDSVPQTQQQQPASSGSSPDSPSAPSSVATTTLSSLGGASLLGNTSSISPRRVDRTRLSRSGSHPLGDASGAHSLGYSTVPTDTARADLPSPFAASGEQTPSLQEEVLESPSTHSVPTSPILSNVRETSSPAVPSPVGGPRGVGSCDRSPDHSYRKSRFRAQRKREERAGRGTEGEGEDGEGRGEGSWVRGEGYREGDVEVKKRTRLSESCPQLQPFMVYKGHRNSRTMIKQANFFGDNWVLSGSDCGRVFIWDKWTGEVVNMFTADSHVVNCVQPHPSAYLIATSGIDYNVKLWEPLASQEASLTDLEEVMRRNEQMLQESRNTITIPSSFLLRILAYLNRSGRLGQPQEQDQSEPD